MRSKADCAVRSKADASKDGAMEQDDGFGFWMRSLTEVIDIAIGFEAADH